MTLDELITALDVADPTLVLPHGFTNPHSYRGYYDELAFEPATDVPVADMLADARSALGATYTGWKGGDFVMRGYTDCWLAEEGSAGGETLGPLLLQFMLDAGIRDAARTASGQQPKTGKPDQAVVDEFIRDMATRHVCGNCDGIDPTTCLMNPDPAVRRHLEQLRAECDAVGQSADPTIADDPIPLRWGLGDVLHGDDDTVIVCLSGPAPHRAPYWLELDPERAAALRDDLAGPAVGQPAEAQAAHETQPPRIRWRVEHYDPLAKEWAPGIALLVRERAVERLEHARTQAPRWKDDGKPVERRLVRETTTWTVENETR
ncbi:hypothetical protein [Streptomyces sp. NPDC056169]|uniref:hypothetical protein n=1 Tax=Streptomyces sp. NPDC056169 TaxID=3345734 RepID=UPI0035DDB2B9